MNNVNLEENKTGKLKFSELFEKFGMILVFIILCIACSILSPVFLGVSNIMNVLRQVSITGIVSMGMTLVILTGGIDLSVASMVSCSTLLVASMQQISPVLVILAVIVFGAAAGCLNGVLITQFRIQPFIVTLGTTSILRGVGLTYSGGSPIVGVPSGLGFFGQGKIFGIIPMQAILFILIALIVGFLLKYTRIGRYTYAIGGNEQAARLSGINVKWMKTLIYMLAGVFSAFAGIIMATHLNVGEASIADGTEMDCIAAAVIGGTSLQGGKGTVLGTVIGVLIIGIFSNLLNLLNVPGYTQSIFKGVIVVGAALLQTMQEKQQN